MLLIAVFKSVNRSFRSLFLLACLAAGPAWGAPKLELRPGDHICIVGNTLADRMQHSGFLEALICEKFPRHDLVFRDLGFSGDELTVRLRSQDFGTPDEWLRHEKADVVFAMFGYNESFKGPEGLPKFRDDLQKFIRDTLGQNYSGKGAARLVLFSPIAQEKMSDPGLPDPAEHNRNIKLYADAMAEVAKTAGVPFIDLYLTSQRAYAQTKTPLTINGIHLSDAGYKALAPAMFQELFDEPALLTGAEGFEKLRNAINEKNEEFFKRYRTMDGYNVYGGRSLLKFDGVMNRDTMQREMEMRDVKTANRDKRVWAVAKGGDLVVKDENLPEPVEVKTNKRGQNPDGTFQFLTGQEAISHMKLPPGCKVNLFASEEQFPELSKPVQMTFDTKGRLWVAVWPNYPERTPMSKTGDKLLVFEDTDGDGKADKVTTFADDLNCPTGFQFYKDGVIVVQAPDVWFLRDTDGDGKADWRERILNGMDSADSHHTANSLVVEPGGAIYLSDGVFHRSQVETPWGPPVRNTDAAIYRFEPRASKFERYASYGFANPHGRVFDFWGNDFITDATGNNTYFAPAFTGNLDYPAKHATMKQFWDRPSRPCAGTGIITSRHFPEEFQGNFLDCNVIGFQGIYRVKVTEDGSGLHGETIPTPLVVSDDPNFRPVGVDVAPDGSVYFLDWHNPIIGHMQHHLRDPNRDHVHGRIYRITYEGRPLDPVVKVAGESIEKLLDLLTQPENNLRTRAKLELGAHDTKQVIAAVQKWAGRFSAKKVEDQHALLEALWVHQWHNVVNEPLLRQMLQSPEPKARAQAVRVLCYWRDRVAKPLDLLRAAANDAAPRVRLEAVRAVSFFNGREALEVAYEILKNESDYYLDYTFKETLKQLQKGGGEIFLPKDPRALTSVVSRMTDKELAAAPDIEGVLMERLTRKTLDLNTHSMALEQLSKLRKTDRVVEAVAALQRLDEAGGPLQPVHDLAMLMTASGPALQKVRPELQRLSSDTHQPAVRSAAWAGLVAADGKPDAAWARTADNPETRSFLIDGIALLADVSFRAPFEPLLTGVIADPSTPGKVRSAALQALPSLGPDQAPKNFQVLAGQLRQGRDMTVASRAVTQLPRDSWDKAQAGPVAEAILAWAKTIPADRRTSQDYVETVQVGNEMASLLPAADSARIRKQLLDLSVRVFVVKTVREQMRYDTTRLVVEAGKPFEIIFENTDMMPHNLVLVQPGKREEVGTQAEKMQPVPDRQGKVFVPRNQNIIASSKLIEPGQKETMKLTAPARTGDYDYVCTYPEHWKVMFGQLVVVKDMDAFLKTSASLAPPQAQAALPNHQHTQH